MDSLLDILRSPDLWETASYVVTVIALPYAIIVYLADQRRERDNEDELAYQLLQDAYIDFLKIVLANPDLQLRTKTSTPNLSGEQRERMLVIFEMLVSLFERAYLVAYRPNLEGVALRRWNSWDDYMREWTGRADFHDQICSGQLLKGEDPDFAAYIRRVAAEENL